MFAENNNVELFGYQLTVKNTLGATLNTKQVTIDNDTIIINLPLGSYYVYAAKTGYVTHSKLCHVNTINGAVDCVLMIRQGTNLNDGLVAQYSSNNNHTYYIYHEPLNWTDSKIFCEARNLHLATITSTDESAFIDTFIGDLTQDYYWLGGTDKDSEGVWRWITNEEWNYDNWNINEPNNDGLFGEDYLHLFSHNGQVKWNDIPNQVYGSMGHICEDDGIQNNP